MWEAQVTVVPNEIVCIQAHCVHLWLMSLSYGKHQLLGPYLPYWLTALVTAYVVPSAVSKDLASLLYQGPQARQNSVMMADHGFSGDPMPLKAAMEMACLPPQNKRVSKSL